MIAALLAGGGFGLGVYLLVRALVPPRPALRAALARLDARPAPAPPGRAAPAARLRSVLSSLVAGLGIDGERFGADLNITEMPTDRLLADKALLGVVGVALPPATVTLMSLGGVRTPVLVPGGLAVAFGVIGFVLPDVLLRSRAAERRRAFRHALGSFLDLVALNLAGGAGPEGALTRAATIGEGWAFELLRDALAVGRSSRESPWAALGRLGRETGVTELVELSASLALAGTEGAKIRESLAAKAESLRRHELAQAESDAAEASERMSLPVVLLFLGFLVLVSYPAVSRVLTGL